MSVRVAVPAGTPGRCPSSSGELAHLGRWRRTVLTEVHRDPDDVPPAWAARAVARTRAVGLLRREATGAAAGVVGVTFADTEDAVLATGLLVRRDGAAGTDLPGTPFTTHLPFEAAGLAAEAGLAPRRVAVAACRAVLHEPVDAWPEPASTQPGEQGTLDHLVGRVRDVAAGAWQAAGRRRGAATVLVGDVETYASLERCPDVAASADAQVVLLTVATVLAGSVDRSQAAREVAARLDRFVVPVGAA